MPVKLISIMQPTPELQTQGIKTPGDLIAYCARVSNPDNQYNTETADKLLKYLIRNKHWSPFEMVDVCLEIETTRDIGRQILRHRSFQFQEFSGRYADATSLGFTYREARLQDPKNRQNSLEIGEGMNEDMLKLWWFDKQREIAIETEKVFKIAVGFGFAKEVARSILPEGLTNSRMYMKGTVRSWLHYLAVRLDPSTQKEHRLVAEECAVVLGSVLPDIDWMGDGEWLHKEIEKGIDEKLIARGNSGWRL